MFIKCSDGDLCLVYSNAELEFYKGTDLFSIVEKNQMAVQVM